MNVDLEYQEEIIYVSPGVYIGGGGRPVLKHHSYMNVYDKGLGMHINYVVNMCKVCISARQRDSLIFFMVPTGMKMAIQLLFNITCIGRFII